MVRLEITEEHRSRESRGEHTAPERCQAEREFVDKRTRPTRRTPCAHLYSDR